MAFNLLLENNLLLEDDEYLRYAYQDLEFLIKTGNIGTLKKILISPYFPQEWHTVCELEFLMRINTKIQEHLGSDFNWHNVMMVSDYVLGILEERPNERLKEMELVVYHAKSRYGIRKIQYRLQKIFQKFIDRYQGKLFGMLFNGDTYVHLKIFIPGKYPIQFRGVLVDSDDKKNILSECAIKDYNWELGYDGSQLHYSDSFIDIVQSHLIEYDEVDEAAIAHFFLDGYHISFTEADIPRIHQKIQKFQKQLALSPLPLQESDENDYDYQYRARAFILTEYYNYWELPIILNKYGQTSVDGIDHLIMAEEWRSINKMCTIN